MPSPFPGMDPYLEDPAIWPDVHITLIVAMRAELNAILPEGYIAAADRHVWIEDPHDGERSWRDPDVYISEVKAKTRRGKAGTRAAVAEPRMITLPLRDHKGKPYLKITDTAERRVITALELLSPTNKTAGADRQAYLEKREEYFAAGVNLVEINLLRKGTCPPLGKGRSTDYYVLVCRANDLPKAAMWSFSVRQRFPDFYVPLRAGEQLSFNLRSCLDRAYREARYDREIDYTEPPFPPLKGSDAVWARALLSAELS